jgi:hypothetical protein
MVAIVERGHNKALFSPGPMSQVVQQLMRQLLGVLVRPRPSVYVEKDCRVPGLLGRQFVDSVQIHGEPGDVDGRLAGTRSVVIQDERIVGCDHLE